MSRYDHIYARHAAEYDELVRHEDREQNLARALAAHLPEQRRLAIDLGAGTGRVTKMLAPWFSNVHAYDRSSHMIAFARDHHADAHVAYREADHTSIPEPDLAADLVVAGWTFGHVIASEPNGWEKRIEDILHEMMRLVAPKGRAIVLETLGTCVDEPGAPTPALGAYYTLLERWYGFTKDTVSTDYAFASADDATRITTFFFGDDVGARVRARGSAIVPEFTGVWTRSQTRE